MFLVIQSFEFSIWMSPVSPLPTLKSERRKW
jgi:hypothetical protein